ncbi:CHC2 zinc finger domain-containing protein [Desulfococcaceae bacterium HSG7]|nr:CHC2 zinc finger domain-containing protein [Desulfococcaceae bacterium HSG7]
MKTTEIIKDSVSIESWLEKKSIEISRVGGDTFNASFCPLCRHADCFRYSEKTQLYKCFSCDTGGDVIDLQKRFKKCDFKTALQEIAEEFNVSIPIETATHEAKSKESKVLDAALAYCQKNNKHAGAYLRYLATRRYHEPIIKSFGVGYVGNGNGLLDHLLNKFDKDALLESGLVRENKNGKLYDFFRNQVLFPFYDDNQNIVHIKGKGIDSSGHSNGKVYQLPLKKKERPIFGKHIKVDKKKPLHICEGETDALALSAAGKQVWSFGGNPSENQLNLIKQKLENGIDIIFVFDNDAGGKQYQKRCAKKFARYAWPAVLMRLFHRAGSIRQAVFPDKYNDIDDALRNQSYNHIVKIKPMFPALTDCIKHYNDFIQVEEIRYNADIVGKIVYEYFDCYGLFFVVNEDCYLIYDQEQYVIDNSMPFKALMYQKANINYANQSSKVIWESIKAQCFLNAQHTNEAAWIHTDHEAHRIHYNLCNEQNELICISPEQIQVVSNGSNPNNIFLFASPKTEPITFIEDVDVQAGLKALFDSLSFLTTSAKWRFYIIGLILNTFLIEFAKARGINKFTGHQGSGKTDAAGLITSLLYGKNFVTISSTASDYTDAALNPFTINDNLEISNLDDERKNFLLCVATGITRQKRKSGTDTKNVYERAITQVITTSIESFEVPELIERAIIVPFSSENFTNDYPGSVVIEKQLIQKRDLILNSLFRLTSTILNDFDTKKAAYLKFIQSNYPNHAKKRLNEHLACIALSVDSFLCECDEARTQYASVEHLLSEWIGEQDVENEEVMQSTNVIVRYLNMLSEEWHRDNLESYGLESIDIPDIKINLKFEASNALLLSAFQLLAKKYGFKQKFKSVRHLATRIHNEKTTINNAGWRIKKAKVVRGQRYYRFIQGG